MNTKPLMGNESVFPASGQTRCQPQRYAPLRRPSGRPRCSPRRDCPGHARRPRWSIQAMSPTPSEGHTAKQSHGSTHSLSLLTKQMHTAAASLLFLPARSRLGCDSWIGRWPGLRVLYLAEGKSVQEAIAGMDSPAHTVPATERPALFSLFLHLSLLHGGMFAHTVQAFPSRAVAMPEEPA
jgi:hypothetical protein